ncbi:MAG TPA: transposase [Chthoniobacteraceae bacterium]|jgi:REP element-mobilizing transposase RayT|nr:transposase [Chthoniobacteraceae bacterium]
MRSRYRVVEPGAAQFVTSTVVDWLPVFTNAARCQIIVDSLEYCRREKGLKVCAWVILDNHLHAVLAAPELPRVMADFKRHTARRLIELFRAEKCDWLLALMRAACPSYKTESDLQFWQEGYHPQALISDTVMLQKLEYLHNNPVQRGLVAAPEHWWYSSAHEWCAGAEPLLRCDPWR